MSKVTGSFKSEFAGIILDFDTEHRGRAKFALPKGTGLVSIRPVGDVCKRGEYARIKSVKDNMLTGSRDILMDTGRNTKTFTMSSVYLAKHFMLQAC